MTGPLAVVDGADQAAAWARAPRAGAEALAVSADAQYELERAGLAYRVPEDFYAAEECPPLRDASLARAYAACGRLEALAREALWPRAHAAFRPYRAFLFPLRHLLDQAQFTDWRLRRAAGGRPLLCFETAPEPVGEDLAFRRESSWSRAAQRLGAEVLPLPAPACAGAGLKGRLRAVRSTGRRLKEAAARGRADLVLLSRGYSLGALGALAQAGGLRARWLEPEALEAPFGAGREAAFWESARGDAELSALVEDGSVERRLRHLAVELAPRAEAVFRRSLAWLRRHKVRAVVGATMNWREKVFAQACRAEGVPVVVYVHGNIGTRHSEAIGYNDMEPSDLYLVNGEAQKRYCLETFPEARCRVEAVGSAALDRLRQGLTPPPPRARPLFVYALGGVRDYRYPQYHRMPSDAFRLQQAVVDLFGRSGKAELVMKLYGPDVRESPIARYVADKAYPNVSAVESPPFSQWLSRADAFLIDFPSTTLSEMALTDRPIYYLDALAKLDWLPEAREAVSKRCVVVETLEQLDSKLGAGLAAPPPAPADASYIEGYGVCRLDGRSLERAWAAVSSAMKPA